MHFFKKYCYKIIQKKEQSVSLFHYGVILYIIIIIVSILLLLLLLL